jgi:hypothetical protein
VPGRPCLPFGYKARGQSQRCAYLSRVRQYRCTVHTHAGRAGAAFATGSRGTLGSSNEDTSKSAMYTVTQAPSHSTTLAVLSTFGPVSAASQPTRRAITYALISIQQTNLSTTTLISPLSTPRAMPFSRLHRHDARPCHKPKHHARH